MKTSTIATIAAASFALFGAASQADARSYRGSGHVYISGYRSCGTPVYTERYVIRHDCHGYPVWGYRTVSHRPVYRPAPGYCAPPPVRVAPPVRCYVPPACPPVHRRSSFGFTIHGGYRR